MELSFSAKQIEWEEDCNIIVGQAHFIKTVDDIAEIMATTIPGAKYGLAFCEASGPCLIRTAGNDVKLISEAERNASLVGAGHAFFLIMRNGYPINVLNQIKNCQEVTRVFAATANPLQIITAETEQGRGIVGVIDGFSPSGVENEEDRENRRELLKKIGYKF